MTMKETLHFIARPEILDTGPAGGDLMGFEATLKAMVKPFLTKVDSLRLCINDDNVTAAKHLAIGNTQHPKDAMIAIIGHDASAGDEFCQVLNDTFPNVQSYQVQQTTPLIRPNNIGHVKGMCQLALFRHQPELSDEEFIQRWQQEHTQVAIETQSNFGYRQHRVLAAKLQGDWPIMHAVVEENFPAAAMTDRQLFFAAENDRDLYLKNQQRMIDSCLRFIDFEVFDCIPSSEYILK